MKKQITIIAIVIIVILVIIGVIYLLKSKVPVIKESIKIGLSAPLSGEAASFGQNTLAGAKLAVDEINQNGGINGRRIELVAEDDTCSKEGVNAFKKLVDIDKPVAIIGPVCSAVGGPALPMAQSAGIPVVFFASAPHLTKIGDYLFRIYPSDSFQGQFAAEFIFNKLNKRKVAILYVKNDWGQGIRDVFVDKFRSLGGEVVFDEGVTQEEKDFRAVVVKLKASNPEIVYMPLYPAGAIAAIKQIRENNLNLPIIDGDAFATNEVIESDVAENAIYVEPVVNIPDDFKEKIKKYTEVEVNIFAPLGYDAVKVVVEAIKRASKLDGTTIRDELTKTSYRGISSPLIEFGLDRELKQPQFEVKIIKNKKAEKFE